MSDNLYHSYHKVMLIFLLIMGFYLGQASATQSEVQRHLALFQALNVESSENITDFSNFQQVKSKISSMVKIDQQLRNKLLELSAKLSGHDKSNFEELAWERISAIDQEHTEMMQKILAHNNWLPISKYGAQTANEAWLIIQHSPNMDLQKQVLASMEDLLESNEVIKPDYALLFDRIAMHEGKPQRYGSQLFTNEQGDLEFYEIEDKDNLDLARSTMELMPIAKYAQQVEEMYHRRVIL